MGKKIKFNLRCDGNPVRNLDDLRDNFVIEDILGYYDSGLLLRWLEVRGFEAEREEVARLAESGTTDQVDLVQELSRIFDISDELPEVMKSAYSLRYAAERREFLSRDADLREREQEIVGHYFDGYQKCVSEIVHAFENLATVFGQADIQVKAAESKKKDTIAQDSSTDTIDAIIARDDTLAFVRYAEEQARKELECGGISPEEFEAIKNEIPFLIEVGVPLSEIRDEYSWI